MKARYNGLLFCTLFILCADCALAQPQNLPPQSAAQKEINKCMRDNEGNEFGTFGECASKLLNRVKNKQEKISKFIVNHLKICHPPLYEGIPLTNYYKYDEGLLGLQHINKKWNSLVINQCALMHQVWGGGYGGDMKSMVCEIEFHQVRNKWLETIAATIQENNSNCVKK